MAAISLLLLASQARAQAPGIAWSNSTGGRIFAVDAQNNVYADSNGVVLRLNSSGVPQNTFTNCPLPALAQRDSSGNFYFFGSFDGTNDFGGITLVGGWTNYIYFGKPTYQPGWPTCFLAKYAGNGGLQWVYSFGGQAIRNYAKDMAMNPDGTLTLAYQAAQYCYIAQYSQDGSNVWTTQIPQQNQDTITIIPLNGTNGAYDSFISGVGVDIGGGLYNSAGGVTSLTGSINFNHAKNLLAENARPVMGTNNDMVFTHLDQSSNQMNFRRYQGTAGIVATQPFSGPEQWLLGSDSQRNIYLAGVDGSLSEYNANWVLIWSGNYGPPTVSLFIDGQGNRFISHNDGSIAKLLGDAVAAPGITNAPVGGEIFAGSNFTFTVGASGYAPLSYYWLFQSNGQASATYVSGGTNATLTINNATAAQSGLYSVIISNVVGPITSTPVTLTVKSVEIFQGSVMLTNGTYNFANPPTLSIHSAFQNGQTYYSLDGSTPNFLSQLYTGPFVLTNSATVKAIGYSADFSHSDTADTVIAIVPPQFTLTTSTAGGGSIALNPSGNLYASNTVVTATATPGAGYSFLYWQGAASGGNATAQILMNQNKSLTAVFGTTLATTVQGNGQVYLVPPGGVYPYGSTVRLEALPNQGSFFGAWGNAASGTTNPLYFTVTSPTPTVSSIFSTLGANQSALTVLIRGSGRISVNPPGNVFSTSQSVTITATPDNGQTFLGWSGDASGSQNPLTVNMNQSRVITARFSGQSVTLGSGGGRMTSQGFQFTAMGEPQTVYHIFSTTNFVTWQDAGYLTNDGGTGQFTDTNGASFKYYRAVLTP